ncbi:MAG: NAD(P)/FAD-dependent oxidoreductase [Pseudomonadota bacterium]
MTSKHPSRRRFLATAASASLLPAAARASLPIDPDVVVVGAGAAGIAAARTLIASGKTVVVIEAAPRIGGRAYTEQDTFGVPYDQGAAWIQGPSGVPFVGLAKQLGFNLQDHSDAGEVFYLGDRRASGREAQAYWSAYARIERAIYRRGDVAAADLVPAGVDHSAAIQSWIGPMDFGVDFADLSTGDVNSYGTYAYNYLVREGYGSIVSAYGRGLPIRTGVRATHIDHSGPGVRVETTAGTISAKSCIVTVSTGVLGAGSIRFTPALPVAKQSAIDNVPMGLLVKIALQFDGTRFGLNENDFLTYAVPDTVPAQASYFLTWPTGTDLSVGFAGGAFGWELSRAGQRAAVDFALGEFVKMMGSDARKHFVKGHMSDWATNPLTLGAYAAARPGHFSDREILAQPVGGKVFFAGEAVAGRYKALVSGAHLSGEKVANTVVTLLGGAEDCGACAARASQRERIREVLK